MFKEKASKFDDEFNLKMKTKKDAFKADLSSLELEDSNARDGFATFSVDFENPFKVIKKELSDLINIYEELGIWSLCSACLESIKTIRKTLDTSKHCMTIEKINDICDSLQNVIFFLIRKQMTEEDESNVEKILNFSSEKVNCLIDIFKASFVSNKFHAIVFVERKYTAFYLNQILEKISHLEEYHFIKSDFVFGNSRQNIKETMNNTKQVNLFFYFRTLNSAAIE